MKTKAEKRAYEKAGRRSETLACWYLRFKGYRILTRRYKTRAGEIDIAARRGKVIAIAEVKQRKSETAAQESVSYQNEQRVMNAAEIFLTRSPALRECEFELRFDIIYVIGRWKIRHITNAFHGY